MPQILTLKREERFSGNPDDESIIVSSNHRTWHMSREMAIELHACLGLFLSNRDPFFENETARTVRLAAEQRDLRAHAEARAKNATPFPSFTALKDLA